MADRGSSPGSLCWVPEDLEAGFHIGATAEGDTPMGTGRQVIIDLEQKYAATPDNPFGPKLSPSLRYMWEEVTVPNYVVPTRQRRTILKPIAAGNIQGATAAASCRPGSKLESCERFREQYSRGVRFHRAPSAKAGQSRAPASSGRIPPDPFDHGKVSRSASVSGKLRKLGPPSFNLAACLNASQDHVRTPINKEHSVVGIEHCECSDEDFIVTT